MAIRPVNTTDTPAYDQTGKTTGAVDNGYYDATKFIPELYSKKVLRNFYEKTFYKEICNTDYEGEIKGQGSKVHIRKTPQITVSPYSIGTKLDYEVPTKDATELLIDQGIYSAFQVDDINKAQADIELVNMFAKDAAERIAIAVDTEVLSFMSTQAAATNKGATAGAISASIDLGTVAGTAVSVATASDTGVAGAIDLIVDINQVLDEANIPSEGRFIVLPAWYCALLKKGDLKAADITGDSTGVIRNGMIGMVDRTVIYQSNNLPTAVDGAGGGDLSWYVIAGTKEAATFASQVDKVDTLKIPDSFGEYWRTLFVYGRAVVQDVALVNALVKKA